MKTTPDLQTIVTQIANRYAVDLSHIGAYLRLQQPGHGQLVLENIGGNRVSITNYITVNGDWVSDPEVVLYTNCRVTAQGPHAWTPLESTQFFRGWLLAAELDQVGGLVVHNPTLHDDLAEFCEDVVAKELRRQSWLDAAVQVNTTRASCTDDELHARDIRPGEPVPGAPRWPVPTTDEPDLETLEEWLLEDGGCETSDGCWTDPDGYCPPRSSVMVVAVRIDLVE